MWRGGVWTRMACDVTNCQNTKPSIYIRPAPSHSVKFTSLQTSMVPKTTCNPSKKLSPMMMTVAPPVVQPSLGLMALMHGVAGREGYTPSSSSPIPIYHKKNEEKKIQLKFWNIPQRPQVKKLRSCSSPSVGSSRLALRPCLELLWTNMLSETASRGPSTFTCEDTITYNNKIYGLEASAKTRPFHQPLSTELTCCRIKSSKNSIRRMRKFRRLVTLAPDDPLFLWGRHTSGQQVTSPSHSERRRL